ncbi:MAG: chorismate-binding protein, partial [Acidobacteriota bacterium]
MHEVKMWMNPAGGELIPVIDTMPADLHTPLSVYLRLAASSKNSFLLESVEGGESLGRYSFIGADPAMVLYGNANSVTVRGPIDTPIDVTVDRPMFEILRSYFSNCCVARSGDLPPFIGGAIGYLGFNCSGWFEESVAGDGDEGGDAEFMFFRTVVAFDHAKQIISVITLVNDEEDHESARTRNSEIRRKLETGPIRMPKSRASKTPETVRSNWTKEEFENSVCSVKELIKAGECYQVVLSQCFSRRTAADPVSIYRAMRSTNPSPYMFLLQMQDRSIIGASPEMLVKCSDRDLEYRPIAGTRMRGKTTD